MAISIVNNTWSVSEKITSAAGTSKTLATAGKFLDRNIQISITPQAGEIDIAGKTEVKGTDQIITLDSNTNKYNLNVKANVTITPTLTEGWISNTPSKNIIITTNSLLDQTILESGLTSDSKLYRVSATKGYNDEKLSKDLNVFQGEITI